MGTTRTDLYHSPAEARHVGELLERLGVRIVVLGKLGLHDLEVWTTLAPNVLNAGRRRGSAGFLTCSCSAVKDVRARLAGLGWLSCSVGTAPSSVIPFPGNDKRDDRRGSRNGSPRNRDSPLSAARFRFSTMVS